MSTIEAESLARRFGDIIAVADGSLVEDALIIARFGRMMISLAVAPFNLQE